MFIEINCIIYVWYRQFRNHINFNCLLPMARRPTYSKKSVKLQLEKLERKCRYCKTHRHSQGFDKHEAWCKKTWLIRKELQESRIHSTNNELHSEATLIPPQIPSSLTYFDVNNDFVEGSSSMPMEVDYPLPELNLQDATVTAQCLNSTLTFSSSLKMSPSNVY